MARKLTYDGRTMTVPAWARLTGIPKDTLYYRLAKGWPAGMALNRTAGTDGGAGDGFPVYCDDRTGAPDRVISYHRTEAEARAEALRLNREELAGGRCPWKAPLYYHFLDREIG